MLGQARRPLGETEMGCDKDMNRIPGCPIGAERDHIVLECWEFPMSSTLVRVRTMKVHFGFSAGVNKAAFQLLKSKT